MTDIAQNAVTAARAVATSSTVERKAASQTQQSNAARVQAKAEAAERVESPSASADSVKAKTAAVEPLSPTGPTRTTAYADDSTGRYVIQVRETDSNEVINQYPPKQLLRFYAAAREALEQAVERAAKARDVSA